MSANSSKTYREAGVDTQAGDRAVELMRQAVSATHSAQVIGGFGGFAGLWDASALAGMRHPVLATSTDGVGTKVAIAQALDIHDTIGQDLVGMVIDDIVVVGARPLFMTDYIACGKVYPERIAAIVRGIAQACAATGTALVGGETAEHPGLLGVDDYDVAGAATGVVEKDSMLDPSNVRIGDVVLALESSGLHSNGFSLVRHILAKRKIDYSQHVAEFGGAIGEALLEPTRLYTKPLLALLDDPALGGAVHALSHVTGGGIAANLARVLPRGTAVTVDRSSWTPLPVFGALSELAGTSLESSEGTWNLGVGFFAVVAPEAAAGALELLSSQGIRAWAAGTVEQSPKDAASAGYTVGAKGVDGGAVRLAGNYAQ